MAWTKAKTALVVVTVAILTVGTATVVVKERQKHHSNAAIWQRDGFQGEDLLKAAPEVRIFPSALKHPSWGSYRQKLIGKCVSPVVVMSAAYDFPAPRIVGIENLPTGKYNYIASLDRDNEAALRKEAETLWGVVGKPEIREQNVLLLKRKGTNASGLKPSSLLSNSSTWGNANTHKATGQDMSKVAAWIEGQFGTPVLDRTGLEGRFDYQLRWQPSARDRSGRTPIQQALLDQLGLELVPAREPIEVLVIQRSR